MTKNQSDPIPSPFQVLLATRLVHALNRSRRHRVIFELLREGKNTADLIDLCKYLCYGGNVETARLLNAINRSVCILNRSAELGIEPNKGKKEVYPSIAVCIQELELNASKFRALFDIDFSCFDINHNSYSEEDLFYKTDAWRKVRYDALVMHGGRCQCCGRGSSDGIVIHVDHIKPRSRYPELALTITNLQILCEDCNLGKGARDETDWREDQPLRREGTQAPP